MNWIMRGRIRWVWVALAIFPMTGFSALAETEAAPEVPLMPLEEIRAGMEGHWRTVVSGTEIQEYPLEVLGVAENFVGPGRSLIICQALDPENILSGPVAGMSGSPVYIDGKLIGAYAYGFTWSKEQAIIGVTPIADMLELFERFEETEGRVASEWRRPPEPVEAAPQGGLGGNSASLPPRDWMQSHLRPLPTALTISGISSSVVAAFADEFRALGLEPSLVPMGRAATEIDADLQPGSAVAGVLLDGDFNVAGTGTVTYRDGDRILAFGHPLFGMGATDLPMAAAEVMTVIRSVQSSFKLSNTGPVIGSIYQDRLSAIAGRIGREAPVTKFTLNIEGENGETRTYSGNLFEHPRLSPLVSAMALTESLTRTMETSREQTFFIRSAWEIEDRAPIVQEDVSSGSNSPLRLAMEHLDLHRRLMNNFYGAPRIEAVTYDISFRDQWMISRLESASIDRKRVKPGETVGVDLVLRNYRGERTVERVEVPVPLHLREGQLTLFAGDAGAALQYEADQQGEPNSLEQILERARRHRGRQAIYLKLVRRAPGLNVEGTGMPNLLPSVASAFQSSQSRKQVVPVSHTTVWETAIPVSGEFRGSTTFPIEIQ